MMPAKSKSCDPECPYYVVCFLWSVAALTSGLCIDTRVGATLHTWLIVAGIAELCWSFMGMLSVWACSRCEGINCLLLFFVLSGGVFLHVALLILFVVFMIMDIANHSIHESAWIASFVLLACRLVALAWFLRAK